MGEAIPNIPDLVREAIAAAGSQRQLAKKAQKAGYPLSQQRISQLLEGATCTDRAALALHAGTGGAVPASKFRPDLWRRPEDVPIKHNGGSSPRRKRNGRRQPRRGKR